MKKSLFEIYDSGLLKMDIKVVSLKGNEKNLLIGSELSPFRPSSGGQPSDRGILFSDGFSAEVEDVYEDEGLIFHKCKKFSGSVKEGQILNAEVDADTRRKYTIMHSAEHLLFSCLKSVLKEKNLNIDIEKVSIGSEESAFFVNAESLNWNYMFEAEELANSIIREARPLRISYSGTEEALSDPGLRIKAHRIREDFVRRIEIEGIDASACTGTHVKNTSEILLILVTSLKSLGPSKFEVKFVAGPDALRKLFAQSREFRKVASLLGSSDSVFESVLRLWNENKKLRERHQQDTLKRIKSLPGERLFGITFYSETLEDEEQKAIVKGMSELCSKQAFALIINRKDERRAVIYLMRSKELDCDLLEFLNSTVFSMFSGRGGGNSGFVTAELEISREQEPLLIEEVRSLILSLK